MIKLYIYNTETGGLIREDTGLAAYVIHDLGKNEDFTLTAPPNYEQPWYWIDDKWTTEPAS